MRASNLVAVAGAVAASAAVSAVALGQGSTWGGGSATSPAPDAGAPIDAGAAFEDAPSPDASVETTLPRAPRPQDASPPPAADGGEDAGEDGGSYVPSNVGFAAGLRAAYGVPFGLANGSPLNQIVQGMVPLGGEAGWFFNPHFYFGGYFIYGVGVGADLNGQCGGEIGCDAEMFRFGVVAHYHLAPEADWDPWFGLGIGYEIINLVATDDTDDSNPLSSALQGVDLTAEVGLDYKPLKYLGIGPYVELATGPYLATDTFGMHGWVNFGLRFRTNL